MDKFTLSREDSVLMVIDIQEKLVPAMEYGEKVIQNTNKLISIAERIGVPIIATEQYPRGLGRTVSEVSNFFEEASIHEKITFSGYNDNIASNLNQLERKKIIITGMETHVCVFQTVRDLLDNGYQVFVVRDAVCSRTKNNYLNGLSLMTSMGAVITNTETVFFDLMKEAGTAEFRELLKLIK
ncbi:isochorismatase family protein [Selenihalanaerobacter shriftii]|uniref:Nicotinamidase-related amidase n=1 Tax=Selenihalanaerobacter shriftii TaxID=142842 RepID=A0A1T4LE20_9FIRM|nr:isochorismatase family protein [Selenihalanaerobacter shriftii]SJZ52900.1 Nicotinamidase-related amidase [Selenihalanaerobacter shriftii]